MESRGATVVCSAAACGCAGERKRIHLHRLGDVLQVLLAAILSGVGHAPGHGRAR
jgi:hypothetical protein